MVALTNDVLSYLFGYVPLYYVLLTCTRVCKQWRVVIMTRYGMDVWKERGMLEWGMHPKQFDGPTWNNRIIVRRVAAAASLLTGALSSSPGDLQYEMHYLIFKGFPLACQRRGLADKLEAYKPRKRLGFVGDDDEESFHRSVAYSIGPFSASELTFTTKIKKGGMWELTAFWRSYVIKLLALCQIPVRSGTVKRDHVAFITKVGCFLKRQFKAPVLLSERIFLIYDRNEEAKHMKTLSREQKRARAAKLVLQRESKRRRHQQQPDTVEEASDLSIVSTVYQASLGYRVDLYHLSLNCPYPLKPVPGGSGMTMDVGYNIKILLFAVGKIVLTGAKDHETATTVYQIAKNLFMKFKV